METYRIEPGRIITINIQGGFYLAESMISLKAMAVHPVNPDDRFSFIVWFKDFSDHELRIPMNLEAPYYFQASTFPDLPNLNEFVGPFNKIEIESLAVNPSLVIQVGFSKRLGSTVNNLFD